MILATLLGALALHYSAATGVAADAAGRFLAYLQVLWIGGDRTQRLRGCLEHDVADHGLVLEGDDLDLLGHGEHHVEVRHVEQFRLTVLEPLGPCETLALRAAAITARVERDPLMAAIVAPLDVAAESVPAASGIR
jgi:hypothetical protein